MSLDKRAGQNWILWAAAIGLALRFLWWWYARPDPVSDFEYTRRLAETILDHHQIGYPRPAAGRVPGYPLFLASLMTINRSVMFLSAANVVLAAALIPLVGRFARALGLGGGLAAVAALACALNPTFVFFSPVLATEHLFIVLLLLSFIIVLGPGGEPPTTSRSVLGGVVFGLSALSRADALFFLPIIMLVQWRRGSQLRLIRSFVFLACTAAAIAPWYIRNRLVIGPGAGLSTATGLNFYYAHNSRSYGWHPLNGTPLFGLEQLELQRRGYEMGLAYLSDSSLKRIASDILQGTVRLYSPSAYMFGLHWSTRLPGPSPDEFFTKRLNGMSVLETLSGAGYRVLLYGALLSLLVVRRYPTRAAAFLYGTIAMNWVGHCWIFWAEPRFRYTSEVVFCVLTAMLVHGVASRFKPARKEHFAWLSGCESV